MSEELKLHLELEQVKSQLQILIERRSVRRTRLEDIRRTKKEVKFLKSIIKKKYINTVASLIKIIDKQGDLNQEDIEYLNMARQRNKDDKEKD